MIFHCLDDLGIDVQLRSVDRLVWMPAHTGAHAIGKVQTSKGASLTAPIWRANRLVDVLAKKAASQHTVGPAILRALKLAEATALHGAALLGMVVHAANNLRVDECQEDGTTRTTLRRDTAPLPKTGKQKMLEGHTGEGVGGAQRPAGTDARAATGPQELARCKAAQRRLLAEEALARAEAAFWANWSGPALAPRAGVPTAAERLEALRRRVMCRSAAASASG